VKVVFDTNVVASATFWRGSPFDCLVAWSQGRCEAVVSPALLAEYHETIAELGQEYPDHPRVAWAEALTDAATLVFPAERARAATPDPNDEMILECAIAAEADAIVVIGSANSSNTLALAKVATAAGCDVVLRVDGPEELDAAALGDARVVGVTAGASAPEDLVQAVIARLAPRDGVVPVHVTDEDEYFPPPRELRELMGILDRTAPVMLGGAVPAAGGGANAGGAFTDDRRVDASDVLTG
jgi:4-hydroxy-3-methylbut-2-enyl diphosphate reductase